MGLAWNPTTPLAGRGCPFARPCPVAAHEPVLALHFTLPSPTPFQRSLPPRLPCSRPACLHTPTFLQVRCQASGETAAVVIRRLLKRGFNMALLKKLYAGAVGAAACAILVGAVHFASYEGSRKAILKWSTAGNGGASSKGSGGGGGGGGGSGRAGGASAEASAAGLGAGATAAAAGGAADAADAAAAAAAAAAAEARAEQDDRFRRAAATFGAAAFAALATALVESPVELFRHNAQAGLVQSNFMAEMAATVRSRCVCVGGGGH